MTMTEERTTTTEHATTTGAVAAPSSRTTDVTARSTQTTIPHGSLWTTSRLITLVFTVVETVVGARFLLKLGGADPEQPLVSAIYGVTGPLVAPFRGIFGQPSGTSSLEIASLLAIIAFALLAALSVAIVRAVTGSRGGPATE